MSEHNLEVTRDIVIAYVQSNNIPADDVSKLIRNVHDTVSKISDMKPGQTIANLEPAVPVKKSITPDFIICLEDGKKFKSLKRHLRTSYNLSPGAYREKWNLPHDYPMVSPNYANARSKLAKKMGLGQKM